MKLTIFDPGPDHPMTGISNDATKSMRLYRAATDGFFGMAEQIHASREEQTGRLFDSGGCNNDRKEAGE